MQFAMYVVIGLTVIWALYLAYLRWSAGAARGLDVRTLQSATPELNALPPRALLYCYSRNCGPCKKMTPLVDELRDAGAPIVKIELSRHMDLARELGIRAAPTLLLVSNGRVEEVMLGFQSPERVRGLLG